MYKKDLDIENQLNFTCLVKDFSTVMSIERLKNVGKVFSRYYRIMVRINEMCCVFMWNNSNYRKMV